MAPPARPVPRGPSLAAIVDVDGTLVDSAYHHALAWSRALARHGVAVPVWRLHRHVGMGGDQLVAAVAGDAVEEASGGAIRSARAEEYRLLIGEVRPLPGARELLGAIRSRGHPVVLASSAPQDELDVYLDLLDARGLVDGWTSARDVARTKPAPDLVHAALARVGGGPAVLVGDTTWDCLAARRARVPAIGLLTGGFADCELREAGASTVFEDARMLVERLADTPLG